MHHREKKTHSALWAAVQFIAWAVVMAAVLLVVTGCKQEPKTDNSPRPAVVRATDGTSCGRCFDRPWLGHEGN